MRSFWGSGVADFVHVWELYGENVLIDLQEAPMRADYPFEEPSDLTSILEDNLLGAWRGRVCGCLLGKPIEGMYQEQILKIARAEDNDPIRIYLGGDPEALRKAGIEEGSIRRLAGCYRPRFMPADDVRITP